MRGLPRISPLRLKLTSTVICIPARACSSGGGIQQASKAAKTSAMVLTGATGFFGSLGPGVGFWTRNGAATTDSKAGAHGGPQANAFAPPPAMAAIASKTGIGRMPASSFDVGRYLHL